MKDVESRFALVIQENITRDLDSELGLDERVDFADSINSGSGLGKPTVANQANWNGRGIGLSHVTLPANLSYNRHLSRQDSFRSSASMHGHRGWEGRSRGQATVSSFKRTGQWASAAAPRRQVSTKSSGTNSSGGARDSTAEKKLDYDTSQHSRVSRMCTIL